MSTSNVKISSLLRFLSLILTIRSSASFLSTILQNPTYQPNTILQQQSNPLLKTKTAMKETSKIIEIEQKFSTLNLSNVLENLQKQNFSPGTKVSFMDWYFDHDDLILCTQDCWLRYRHLSESPEKGKWQVKKGQRTKRSEDVTTVYEELEGDDAVTIVISLLEASGVSKTVNEEHQSSFDSYTIPDLPNEVTSYGLKPFARIETVRSTWKKETTNNIVVDIDETDFGYMVGEVETVVHCNEDVEDAQVLVKRFINDITDDASSDLVSPVLGKLETYLIRNRPDVYDACVSFGTLQKINK